MSGDHDLLDSFAKERAGDLRRTPPFERVRQGRLPRDRVRAISPARLALATGLGVASVVGLLAVLGRNPDQGTHAIQLAQQVSRWRSSTDFLLRMVGSEYLTTIPRIGEISGWYPLAGEGATIAPASDGKGSDSL